MGRKRSLQLVCLHYQTITSIGIRSFPHHDTSPARSPTVPLIANSIENDISFEEGALYSEVAYVSCDA